MQTIIFFSSQIQFSNKYNARIWFTNQLEIFFSFQFMNGESNSPPSSNLLPNRCSSQNVLRARRGVIRMLIIVVLTFALCNLPLHARKMWQYWSPSYRGSAPFSAIFTPVTFLITYINSGVNPLLYAFLSRNFRR